MNVLGLSVRVVATRCIVPGPGYQVWRFALAGPVGPDFCGFSIGYPSANVKFRAGTFDTRKLTPQCGHRSVHTSKSGSFPDDRDHGPCRSAHSVSGADCLHRDESLFLPPQQCVVLIPRRHWMSNSVRHACVPLLVHPTTALVICAPPSEWFSPARPLSAPSPFDPFSQAARLACLPVRVCGFPPPDRCGRVLERLHLALFVPLSYFLLRSRCRCPRRCSFRRPPVCCCRSVTRSLDAPARRCPPRCRSAQLLLAIQWLPRSLVRCALAGLAIPSVRALPAPIATLRLRFAPG